MGAFLEKKSKVAITNEESNKNNNRRSTLAYYKSNFSSNFDSAHDLLTRSEKEQRPTTYVCLHSGNRLTLEPSFLYVNKQHMPPWSITNNPIVLPSMLEEINVAWRFLKKHCFTEFLNAFVRIAESKESTSLDLKSAKLIIEALENAGCEASAVAFSGKQEEIVNTVQTFFTNGFLKHIKNDESNTELLGTVKDLLLSFLQAVEETLTATSGEEFAWTPKEQLSFLSVASVGMYLVIPMTEE